MLSQSERLLSSRPSSRAPRDPSASTRSVSSASGWLERKSAMEKAFSDLELEWPAPSHLSERQNVPEELDSNETPLRLVIVDSEEDDLSEEEDYAPKTLTDSDERSTSGSPSTSTSSSFFSVGSRNSSWFNISPSQSLWKPDIENDRPSIALLPKVESPDARAQTSSDSSFPASAGLLALEKFLNGPIGVDLETSCIAHDRDVQSIFDREEIAWGVQYELARGVAMGHWNWDDVKAKIDKLKGNNAETAYRVIPIMLGTQPKASDLSLWQELDREQLAILENRERGLGLLGDWEGDADWYGGQIQQIARLVKHKNSYMIQLEAMEKRRSNRFARYLGSRRIIQLRIPEDYLMREPESLILQEYLTQKFVLCGRIFVPFHAKDKSVYMVEVNENYQRQPSSWCGDQYRRSLIDIINWHNPLDANKNQPISKWTTRFDLAMSNSVPVVIFDEEDILRIDDIYASDLPTGTKAAAEKIMTDGCGFINDTAASIICRKLGLPYRPTAVQGRLAGAKGLFILHPTDKDQKPKVWIRKSQNKITLRHPLGRAHRIFDLLAVSLHTPPAALTKQSVVNLSHNGVPDDVLIGLMVEGLTGEVEPLMDWQGSHSMISLWGAINRLGNVTGTRAQRQAAGRSRALGLQGRTWGESDVETDDGQETPEAPVAYTGRNESSGVPLALHEVALELIQSGFRPDEMEYLREKVRYIVKQTIDSTIEKCRIPLPMSSYTFIVPDPIGILEEGEIYYRSVQPILNPETQTYFNTLTGDVLIGRYPLRLPSDIQKFKAVDYPELFNWPDIVIVSTKGTCSPASLLAGGDYDGDEVFVITSRSLVDTFEGKEPIAMPANLIQDNFEGQAELVTTFAERAAGLSVENAQKAFQEVLILGLHNSKLGLYSMFHDNTVSKYGLDDPRAMYMAHMFNILLDSSKTGLRLRPGIFEKHRAQFGKRMPEKRELEEPFILDALCEAGNAEGEKLLRKYDTLEKANKGDHDLLAPYRMIASHALDALKDRKDRRLTDELKLIRDHVERASEVYKIACLKKPKVAPSDKKIKYRRDQKDPMQDAANLFAEKVEDVYLITNVEAVKASYAYERSQRFAFAVAFRDLCLIKARASPGGVAPTIRSFDEAKAISSSYRRAMSNFD